MSLGNYTGQWQGRTPTHLSSDCLWRHSAHTHNVSVTKNIDRKDKIGLGFSARQVDSWEGRRWGGSLCSQAMDKVVVGCKQKWKHHAHGCSSVIGWIVRYEDEYFCSKATEHMASYAEFILLLLLNWFHIIVNGHFHYRIWFWGAWTDYMNW